MMSGRVIAETVTSLDVSFTSEDRTGPFRTCLQTEKLSVELIALIKPVTLGFINGHI